jgi:NAD(P)H-dependent flavin oxidoreductase YrpB (nitropropane dioxygenase family)
MLETSITRQFELKAPIINAGMAFVAGPELAAAVANAGGLGMLGGAMVPAEGLRAMIAATRNMTERSFGVDLIGNFIGDEHIEVLVQEAVALVAFFWSGPSPDQVRRLKEGGVKFWMQVGSLDEAKASLDLGAEALVVQGSEAGGHNRSVGSLTVLLSELRDAGLGVPLIAAGGIADGVGMASALLHGAEAVWCGTRFLASQESDAHDDYKRRVVHAKAGGTAMTTIFGPEWPDQPMRVLINKAVRAPEGRLDAARRGVTIGTTVLAGQTVPVPCYSAILPTRDFDADLEWACLTAGECSATIKSIEPASYIISTMAQEAEKVIARIASARG